MVEQTDVPSEWDNVNVIVWDSCHYPSPPKKSEMVQALNSKGEDLINKLAEEMGYPKDAFEVKWNQNTIEPVEQKTLRELGFNKKEKIYISRRQGVKVKRPASFNNTKNQLHHLILYYILFYAFVVIIWSHNIAFVMIHALTINDRKLNPGQPCHPCWQAPKLLLLPLFPPLPQCPLRPTHWSPLLMAPLLLPLILTLALVIQATHGKIKAVENLLLDILVFLTKVNKILSLNKLLITILLKFYLLPQHSIKSCSGATCYMNSLIQTLYMTPEFRWDHFLWNCNY